MGRPWDRTKPGDCRRRGPERSERFGDPELRLNVARELGNGGEGWWGGLKLHLLGDAFF